MENCVVIDSSLNINLLNTELYKLKDNLATKWPLRRAFSHRFIKDNFIWGSVGH